MKAPYQLFKGGETRNVPVDVWYNGEYINSETWDIDLWIERGEDWYALSSPEYKNKKVRIIKREDYLQSEIIK